MMAVRGGAVQVLVINPGSTSTKVALFGRKAELFRREVSHPLEELARFASMAGQLQLRRRTILEALRQAPEFQPGELAAVIGRGGLLRPLPGGVYRVSAAMKEDLSASRYGSHASNLGALIADELAVGFRVPAFIADPVVVDELSPLARYSGLPEIPRRSIFHALNHKAAAKRAAGQLARSYEECTLIVAHLGGGVSVGIHQQGRVTDVNNALDGDGPFSIERAGGLPSGDWLRFILAHREEPEALQRRLTGRGGVVAYLGTNDARLIEETIRDFEARGEGQAPGPERRGGMDGRRCREVLQAMCYRIAKEICSLAAMSAGRLDAVVLTGGLANMERIVADITARVSFLAPVLVFPGENEMEALAAAAWEALDGRVPVLEYGPSPS
jgi:butyrate kinase